MALSEKKKKRHREYLRDRYHSDPTYRAKHKANVVANKRANRKATAQLLLEFESGGCALCSEKESCCLVAHHRDPSTKEFAIADGRSRHLSPKRIETELDKCVCLCANCHAKVHAGLMGL